MVLQREDWLYSYPVRRRVKEMHRHIWVLKRRQEREWCFGYVKYCVGKVI
jgi:hypothetical protein